MQRVARNVDASAVTHDSARFRALADAGLASLTGRACRSARAAVQRARAQVHASGAAGLLVGRANALSARARLALTVHAGGAGLAGGLTVAAVSCIGHGIEALPLTEQRALGTATHSPVARLSDSALLTATAAIGRIRSGVHARLSAFEKTLGAGGVARPAGTDGWRRTRIAARSAMVARGLQVDAGTSARGEARLTDQLVAGASGGANARAATDGGADELTWLAVDGCRATGEAREPKHTPCEPPREGPERSAHVPKFFHPSSRRERENELSCATLLRWRRGA